MSHYTVLIIGEKPEAQLEPFWELDLNRKDMLNDKRAVFVPSFKIGDLEKEFKKFKEEHKKEMEEAKEDYWERYKTCSAEYWVNNWGGNYLNKEKTHYGYYHNPNAKWDWHSLGGRWTGSFKLKKGCKGETGEPGLGKEHAKGGFCDQARKGDIDFFPDKKEYNRSIRFWELYVEGKEPKNKNEKEIIEHELYKREYFLDKFKTKERYAQLQSEFSTYAVLKDGEWFESGKMGWWGMSDATAKEEGEFKEGFYEKWIKNLPDETLLSVYDCHI